MHAELPLVLMKHRERKYALDNIVYIMAFKLNLALPSMFTYLTEFSDPYGCVKQS